jgi:serine/threonine-protein kinase RsbT
VSEIVVAIATSADIVEARRAARQLAADLGFSSTEATLVATAISELARNIVAYAGTGRVVVRKAARDGRSGITVVAEDQGPGIPDIARAMQDGFSTGNGLGLGLPGTKRLMDEMEIRSSPGAGTTVVATKWVS